MLSKLAILKEMSKGNIVIEPFRHDRLNPNSYNVCLGPEIIIPLDEKFDITKPIVNFKRIMLELGQPYELQPHVGYLGHTIERIYCRGFIPWIDGRSTTGRYFLQVHQTAGKGDDGFDGTFTLEIKAVYRPLTVYAGAPLTQVFFFRSDGESTPYDGRYQGQTGPQLPKPLILDGDY